MAEHSRSSHLHLRSSEHRAILLAGDLLASILAVFGALIGWRQYSLYILVSGGISTGKALKFLNIVVPFWFYLLPLVWLMLLIDVYDPHAAANWRTTLRGIAIAAFLGIAGYSLIFITIRDPNSLPRIGVGAFLLLASLLTLGWRLLYIRLYTSPGLMRRVVVVGAGKAGYTLVQVYQMLTPPPFTLIGFIDDDPKKTGKKIEGFQVLNGSDQLLKIVEDYDVTDLVVAVTGEMRGRTFQALLDAQERGIEVTRMPIVYEELVGRVPVHHLESDWVIRSFVDQARVSGFYLVTKRLMDIVGGLIGVIFFVAVFPFAALATLIDSGFPIFYSQTRLGSGGLTFKIYKFRTMYQDAEADGQPRLASENDPRVTRVGYVLRSIRLDELPQFINVLRGEMSLVGPRAERPELVREFQKQIPFYRARLLAKPGLTGWAQVNYGYVSTVFDTSVKLEYDLYYIKHRTFFLDLVIILRTIGTVLSGRGR
jgi:exopolysaccharide biosynthesis polyprenyl glycosylphosphotransferase